MGPWSSGNNNYRGYTDEELEEFLKTFPYHLDRPIVFREQELRQWIKSELAAQDRDAARSRDDANRHQENQTLGEKTLFWAKVGGIAAVIGTIGFLLKDTPLSKLLPSMSSPATPLLSPQAIATAVPLESPTATESPSATPQASQIPEATATPE